VPYETKTQIAVRELRERISSGEISPGDWIRLRALTEDLNMSPTPIREALRLLEADGLIVNEPHVGIRVRELAPEEASEIYMLRETLEPRAVELAIPRMDDAALAELERIHTDLDATIARGDANGITQQNANWHWAIYDCAKEELLREFIQQLWARFPWRTTWVLPERLEITRRDHDAIMVAVRDRDAERAADLMREHISGGRESTFAGMVVVSDNED
jgi:DNA-binding GntR family transcriptional regulator